MELKETKDNQINLVVNQPDSDEITIDLGNVFHNMKLSFRLFAWVMVLCMIVGICAPLLLYQIRKSPTTVYSAVRLDYTVYDQEGSKDEGHPVTDLSAPDGTKLDLNQITSAYVLQNALSGIELSKPLSLSNLRQNITIQRILDEDSQRQQEILNAMLENNNSGAYDQMAKVNYNYTNSFIVSLRNSFGDEDSRKKTELEDAELGLLLNQILISYNDYLVKTYADAALPGDDISTIDIEELDIPEAVDQLRSALKDLYTYCESQPEDVRAYRSGTSGRSLNDLMKDIEMIQEVDVEYLSAYVYANGIARNRDEVIDNHRYSLEVTKAELQEIQENIEAVTKLLDTYKNDEILISSPDSESTQTAVTNTAYYNELIKKQADNQQLASEKETEIKELESRIGALENARNTVTEKETQEAETELQRLLENCSGINAQIRAHMEEVHESAFYKTMAEHSAALSTKQSFIRTNIKKVAIGLVAGLFIGFVIWGIAALIPEFSKNRKSENSAGDQQENTGKEEETV